MIKYTELQNSGDTEVTLTVNNHESNIQIKEFGCLKLDLSLTTKRLIDQPKDTSVLVWGNVTRVARLCYHYQQPNNSTEVSIIDSTDSMSDSLFISCVVDGVGEYCYDLGHERIFSLFTGCEFSGTDEKLDLVKAFLALQAVYGEVYLVPENKTVTNLKVYPLEDFAWSSNNEICNYCGEDKLFDPELFVVSHNNNNCGYTVLDNSLGSGTDYIHMKLTKETTRFIDGFLIYFPETGEPFSVAEFNNDRIIDVDELFTEVSVIRFLKEVLQ